MRFIADLHIHSHYSIATSKNLVPECLEYWARLKGIHVVGTGDCIHPAWMKELSEKLEPAGNGLYTLKKEYRLAESLSLAGERVPREVHFILTGEISNIYKKDGRVRKVHNVCVFPEFAAAQKVQSALDRMGNIESDGRPILGLDSKILLEMVLESSEHSFLFPAHIWTPWFSVMGSKSGFDSVDQCYDDLAPHIFAAETGLSSDPAMNWACSSLDRFTLISNSDAHSPEKLGREANLFDTDLSFAAIRGALKSGDGFQGTIEFFPQEGKYHHDGHRKCGIAWDPLETLRHGGLCPVCGKGVTRGVMYRVAELADRTEISAAPNRRDFRSITQLPDLLAEVLGQKSGNTKSVERLYHRLIREMGPEFYILLDAGLDEIEASGGDVLAEGIRRLREGEVIIEEGYDGEFGTVRVFRNGEASSFSGSRLFSAEEKRGVNRMQGYSVGFNIEEFQRMKIAHGDGPETGRSASGEIHPSGMSSQAKALSPEQERALKHGEGPCMVIAGPGTGKTAILTGRIVYLVKEMGIPPQEILAVTFSNRAAQEMRDRVARGIDLQGLTICTFHALGLSILREKSHLIGRSGDFCVIDDAERMEILEDISGGKKGAQRMARLISAMKEGRGLDEDIAEQMDRYENELAQRDSLDLSDLIALPVRIFSDHGEMLGEYRTRYRWILVDEFQDINAMQYLLVRLLAGEGTPNLFVIGDPDQAIYRFRGSDPAFIAMVREDYPETAIIHLGKSYRCPDAVMRAAAQAMASGGSITGTDFSTKIRIHEMKSERSEADWIAGRIEKAMGGVRSFSLDSGMADGSEEENMSFSDFAVLCRTSAMFGPFIEAFSNHGIAFQVVGNESIFQQDPFRSSVSAMRKAWHAGRGNDHPGGVVADIREMMEKGDAASDILKFIMVVHEASDDEIAILVSRTEGFGNDYVRFFRSLALRQGIDDRDEGLEAVSLMTIHAAKGLEFDTVFIPGCEEGILPFTLFGDPSPEDLAEEERLFYVGVTRTERHLYLTHAGSRSFKGRVLRNRRSHLLDRLERDILDQGKRTGRAKKGGGGGQLELF